mgnify:CR=1 FL=1
MESVHILSDSWKYEEAEDSVSSAEKVPVGKGYRLTFGDDESEEDEEIEIIRCNS